MATDVPLLSSFLAAANSGGFYRPAGRDGMIQMRSEQVAALLRTHSMKTSPIRRVFDAYRGRDPRQRAYSVEFNRVAAKVAAYLDGEIAVMPDKSVRVFESYRIAAAIGESSELVHRIVYAIDGGSNGITCFKGDAAEDENAGGRAK